MQPVPTYEDLPVVFSAAPQVEIPDPTIDTGYGEGVALPTEHFSWLEYKISKKIDELATSTLSVLGELDSYLTSRGVTPSGVSVTQFQTALAAQITGASVASAAKLTTARTIGGVSFDGTANINLPGVNATGNQNTTGTSTRAYNLYGMQVLVPGSDNISSGMPVVKIDTIALTISVTRVYDLIIPDGVWCFMLTDAPAP